MSLNLKRRRRAATFRSERGAAFVELAIATPLLVLIIVGAVDFARVFYMAMVLQNAARAGAQYGASSVGRSTETGNDTGNISLTAKTSANVSIGTISAFSSRLCQCATNTGVFSAAALGCSDPCTGQHLVLTVTVTAAKDFSLISAYPLPGVPHTFNLSRAATLRVIP